MSILLFAAQLLQHVVPDAMMQTSRHILLGCGLAMCNTTVLGGVTRDFSDLHKIYVRPAKLHLRVHTISM